MYHHVCKTVTNNKDLFALNCPMAIITSMNFSIISIRCRGFSQQNECWISSFFFDFSLWPWTEYQIPNTIVVNYFFNGNELFSSLLFKALFFYYWIIRFTIAHMHTFNVTDIMIELTLFWLNVFPNYTLYTYTYNIYGTVFLSFYSFFITDSYRRCGFQHCLLYVWMVYWVLPLIRWKTIRYGWEKKEGMNKIHFSNVQ